MSEWEIKGLALGAAAAGIKYADRDDLVLLHLSPSSQVAAVFTRNAFCAAPVVLARQHLHSGAGIRALLINSGNANAGTGAQGMDDAQRSCAAVAKALGCTPEQVLPFSTGVIGERLPVERMEAAVPHLSASLGATGWEDAAQAIMTTDTVPKLAQRELVLDSGERLRITGMAKGSGMIRPDMATMLAYVATDASIDAETLQSCLHAAVEGSFNRISVDGDTSTNDACVLVATGQGPMLAADSPQLEAFQAALNELCEELAIAVVRDGEGATRLVQVSVEEADTAAEALAVAYTIAHSPLVKTALFAGDPNWGRILAAVGRSGIEDLALERVQIYLDEVCIVRNGARDPDYTEAAGQAVMARQELEIRVVLGRGEAAERVWTCDFSYDYVRINAEYRT